MPHNVLYQHHVAQISWEEHSLQLLFSWDRIAEQYESTLICVAGSTTDAA